MKFKKLKAVAGTFLSASILLCSIVSNSYASTSDTAFDQFVLKKCL